VPQLTTQRSRGQVLVLFALMAIMLMTVAGLAVDGGYMMARRQRQQGAADLAALNGAACLITDVNTGQRPPQCLAQGVNNAQTEASTLASTTATAAGYSGVTPQATSSQVTVNVVTQPPTFFLQLMGISSLRVSASAVAGAAGLTFDPSLAPLAGCGSAMFQKQNLGHYPSTPTHDILLGTGTAADPFRLDTSYIKSPTDPGTWPDGTLIATDPYRWYWTLQGAQMSSVNGGKDTNGANGCPQESNFKGAICDPKKMTTHGDCPTPRTFPYQADQNGGNDDAEVNSGPSNVGPGACPGSGQPNAPTWTFPDVPRPNPVPIPTTRSQCSLWLPIIGPGSTNDHARLVTWGCFEMYEGNNGNYKWWGILRPASPTVLNPANGQPYCNYGQFTGAPPSGFTVPAISQLTG
jgi:Flp pilus assembly protein TadG